MVDEPQEAVSGVLTGTHAPDGADLFGQANGEAPVKAAGSRAGRPNKLSRIMAAKVQDEHGTTVLQAMAAQALASLPDLAREAIEAAKVIATEMGDPAAWKDLVKDSITVGALRQYRLACGATAAPYLHAKRAPEDGKGRTQPVVIGFMGMTGADLARGDQVMSDDDMVIDLEAEVLGVSTNQALSDQRSGCGHGDGASGGENDSNASEVAP